MSARILRDDGAVPKMSDCDEGPRVESGGSESALPGAGGGEEVPGGGGLQEEHGEEGTSVSINNDSFPVEKLS